MVKIYYRGSCGSSRRAFSWFEKYNIDVQKEQISKITRNDLVKLLQHSDQGFKDIVKRSGKSKPEVREALKYMEYLPFSEAIKFIISHPYVLQTPIIIDEHIHLIGYNEDEIRRFLPTVYRRHQLLSK